MSRNWPVSNGRRIVTKLICWLIVLCAVSGGLPIWAGSPVHTPDVVFCPLLNSWVKRDREMPPVKAPLDRICAPTDSKIAFFIATSKRYVLIKFVPNSEAAEKLFFRYLQRGKQALSELTPLPGGPSPESTLAAAREQKTATSFVTDLAKERIESFTFDRFPRPPTSTVSINISAPSFSKLETVAQNASPRGPPLSN